MTAFCDSEQTLQHEGTQKELQSKESWTEEVRSDLAGVRTLRSGTMNIAAHSSLAMTAWDNFNRDYGDDSISRSKERFVHILLTTKLYSTLSAFSEVSSYSIGTDIKRMGDFGHQTSINSTSSLSVGARYEIVPNLELKLAQGFAICSNQKGIQELLPTGAARISYNRRLGGAYFEMGQSSDGDNALAGIYGTQYRRKVGFGWNVNLSSEFSLAWFCEFSRDRAIQKDQISALSQVQVSYQISPTVFASAGLGHRSHIDTKQGIRVNDGLISSFSLSAHSF